MTISLAEFFGRLQEQPVLLGAALLILGVVLVNGWTDAPGAIATCISTRAMRPRPAIAMAAVCNLLGVVVMSTFHASVAMTIYHIADFGGDSRSALVALLAAMVAIIVWATAAWLFGIPTSESHALVAGISGAAVALHGGFSGIHGGEWAKVLLGLFFSVALGFLLGYCSARLTAWLFRRRDRRDSAAFFRRAQIFAGAAMAFMHGAQDGQKFIGVFLLGVSLSAGQASSAFTIPLWLMLLCSAFMALGTSMGGLRIVKTMGMDMVRLSPYQGFSADLAGAVSLLVSTLAGFPVSTTHTKTTAMMGVGAARKLSSVHWGVVGEMALAWLLTFPGCALIGYLMAKLLLMF
ncbi:inorganic phosphate transporter [Christensenellaceae bacterium NSJ-63]|uniref:Inorganic phosphate transporter n=1 Tax=Guopingia tenuis TaxID=2763656 RepID=A0A926DIM4_9FIRM|nr:inorganic phosphate transporter [Guopingia tenuis]MBC8538467.1 inorganic phosphate transporter [Guopingia tenuis]